MIEMKVCPKCEAQGKTDPSKCDDCIELHRVYAESMGKPDPVQVVNITCTYNSVSNAMVELPMFKTWDDVEEWYIKYDILFYRLKGETEWGEAHLNGDMELEDTKRPLHVTIYDEDYNELEER